jgi:hypothetical protein
MGIRLVTAILARDEAGPDRYLTRVLTRALEFSDTVVLLDDGSTDRTAEYALNLGAKVRLRKSDSPAWGNESSARRELWEYACEYATDYDDWILICDADQEFVGNPRELCLTRELNAWSVVLMDMWTATHYRTDGYWQAHRTARPWLFAPNRTYPGYVPQWNEKQIHTGHAPVNWPYVPAIAPPDEFHILHWGWSKPEHRAAKHAAYLNQSHQLSAHELSHAQSIIA